MNFINIFVLMSQFCCWYMYMLGYEKGNKRVGGSMSIGFKIFGFQNVFIMKIC